MSNLEEGKKENNFMTRLVAEREELAAKLKGLNAFLCSPAFDNVIRFQQVRLQRQSNTMISYLEILDQRIENLTNGTENFPIKGEGLTFGQAIENLKNGEIVARAGWNGKGMFVFKQIPAEIGLDIIPKMQSVPQSAKDRMIRTETPLKYTNQMVLVQPDGRVDSWVPSSSDVFAEDWCIVN